MTLPKLVINFMTIILRGGEGHMEVGKLIQNVVKQKVNMTLSIKPFGCMPSSSVSDGVQSLITELYPSAIFLPIETNGDGAVNVYSRVQMQLFKAKQAAEKELKIELEKNGLTVEQFKNVVQQSPAYTQATYRSAHSSGCTAVDLAADVSHKNRNLVTRITDSVISIVKRRSEEQRKHLLDAVHKAAEEYQKGMAMQSEGVSVVKVVEP